MQEDVISIKQRPFEQMNIDIKIDLGGVWRSFATQSQACSRYSEAQGV